MTFRSTFESFFSVVFSENEKFDSLNEVAEKVVSQKKDAKIYTLYYV
jgi:hypothetical protein